MAKTYKYHEITEEQIDEAISKLRDRIARSMKKKGSYPFKSRLEAFGKLQEEMYEVTKEVHQKDWKKFDDELLDVCTVCIWNLAAAEQFNGK